MPSDLEPKIKVWLKGRLSEPRYRHSLGARDCAAGLAKHYGVPEEPLRLAGLLHDCCRELSPPETLALARAWALPLRRIDLQFPVLLHGRLAAETARREFGIEDGAALSAVRYHTAGHPGMSLSDRIFFLCDHMEPNRTGEHLLELRRLALEDLDAAMRLSVDLSISYLHATGKMVDPDTWLLRESLHSAR